MRVKDLNLIGRRKAGSLLDEARDAQRLGNWAEAYKAYSSALRQDDHRFGILVQMGHMSKEMGNYPQAEGHYFEALALQPEDADLHLQIGHLYNRSGNIQKARDWYVKANAIQPTPELSEQLRNIDDMNRVEGTRELRQKTLEAMDAGRFRQALPNAMMLYESHGLRDFDVIAGHALRELGQYSEARDMYEKYFERCIESNDRSLDDAFWHLMNILEILEERHEILRLFARLKVHYFQMGNYSDLGSDKAELLQSHIGKLYGVFRR